MPTNEINFSAYFGNVVKQYQCPHCNDIYILGDNELNEGITHCWKCHQPYLQRVCTTSTPEFIRKAIHRLVKH